MLHDGKVEVVYSTAEKIGLPNWSFMTVMASAKTTVDEAEFEPVYDHLFMVVDLFIKERVEAVTRALQLWANLPTQTLTEQEKAQIDTGGVRIATVELTYSVKETVGLPEKSSVDLLGSVKGIAAGGNELVVFERLASKLMTQMTAKRDLVLANVRPWTAQH